MAYYNTQRPHQALDYATPLARFEQRPAAQPSLAGAVAQTTDRSGDGWVSRKVAANGVVCVAWQQVSVGKHRAGARCDVLVTDQLLQLWVGDELLKTVPRTSTGEVRKKNASGTSRRS